MRTIVAVAALLFAPAGLQAQARSAAAPVPPAVVPCSVTAGGEELQFDRCAGAAAARGRDIETMGWMEGTARGAETMSGTVVRVLDIMHRDIAVRHVGTRGPAEDVEVIAGDGVVSRRVPAGADHGNVVLEHRSAGRAGGVLDAMWRSRDVHEGGYAVRITLGGDENATHISLDNCVPTQLRPGTEGVATQLTLRCPSAVVEAGDGASAPARWIAHAPASLEGASMRSGTGARTAVRMYDATLGEWWLHFDDETAEAVARWTLEVRVGRWEPGD
jgi:hypothetical protein